MKVTVRVVNAIGVRQPSNMKHMFELLSFGVALPSDDKDHKH